MKNKLLNMGKILLLPAIIYGIFLMIKFNRFYNINTIIAIVVQSVIPTIIAYSYSFSNSCGVFDFSLGSRLIIIGIVGGLLSQQFGFLGMVLGCFFVSVILSIVNGILNWKLRIPSLILTMGLTMIYEIVGKQLAGGYGFIGVDSKYTFLGSKSNLLIMLIISAIIFYYVQNYTKFSFEMRAVGSDEITSKNAGINPSKVKFLSFLYGSIFLAIAAVLTLSNSGSIGAQTGLASSTILFKPLISIIMAVAMQGFTDLTIGIFISQLSLNIIFVGLIAIGMPDTTQDVVLGVFLLVVMIANNIIDKNKESRKQKTLLTT